MHDIYLNFGVTREMLEIKDKRLRGDPPIIYYLFTLIINKMFPPN
jgi:hypothetical protein